jgi:hypothetical protein
MDVDRKVVRGEYRGYPVQLVSAILDNWQLTVTYIVPTDFERASTLDIKRTVRDAGLGGKGKIKPDHVFIEMAGPVGRAKAPQIKQVLDSVIDFISGAPVASRETVGPGSVAASAEGAAVSEFASLTGIRQEGTVAFGQYRGYLVKLAAAFAYCELMVAYPQADDHVRIEEKLETATIMEDAGLTGKERVEPGRISIGVESTSWPTSHRPTGTCAWSAGVSASREPCSQTACPSCYAARVSPRHRRTWPKPDSRREMHTNDRENTVARNRTTPRR